MKGLTYLAPDLAASKAYYQKLGFTLLSEEKPTLFTDGKFLLESVGLLLPGRFNFTNGLAALSVFCYYRLKIRGDELSSFPGIARRQAVLHDSDVLTVMEDYAHHPAEIEALIKCLDENCFGERGVEHARESDERPLIMVFQPHRYSRTKQFKEDFVEVLSRANQLL